MWTNIIQDASFPNRANRINKAFKKKLDNKQTDLIFIKEEDIEG